MSKVTRDLLAKAYYASDDDEKKTFLLAACGAEERLSHTTLEGKSEPIFRITWKYGGETADKPKAADLYFAVAESETVLYNQFILVALATVCPGMLEPMT